MTAIYKYMPVRISSRRARFLSSCTNMQQVDRPSLYGHANSPYPINLAFGAMPRPSKPSARISRYQQWQGPNGLASLDRDPVPLRNTVRPDAALPRCESQALAAVRTGSKCSVSRKSDHALLVLTV